MWFCFKFCTSFNFSSPRKRGRKPKHYSEILYELGQRGISITKTQKMAVAAAAAAASSLSHQQQQQQQHHGSFQPPYPPRDYSLGTSRGPSHNQSINQTLLSV
jgi:hypothetical protein